VTERATRRPAGFIKPSYWSDAPPPAPRPAQDGEEQGPKRYGDWVRKGIAVDF
jgi:hypothetical protein